MAKDELKQAAIDTLARAFRGDDVQAHVVQAAVAVLLSNV